MSSPRSLGWMWILSICMLSCSLAIASHDWHVLVIPALFVGALAASAGVIAISVPVYYFVHGVRNREAGIPCPRCHARAFPIERTAGGYRCASCHTFFEGPAHW
jgi:hypothetical protein